MNVLATSQTGLTTVISQLQKQKEILTVTYHEAISKGEKLNDIKTLYINLKDVDKKLSDLLRVCNISI
ncbi:MAG: hypothetical protein ABJB05_03055 [Parafilimonas sp.]